MRTTFGARDDLAIGSQRPRRQIGLHGVMKTDDMREVNTVKQVNCVRFIQQALPPPQFII